MTLVIDRPDDQHQRFVEAAHALGVDPRELAKAAVVDLLGQSSEDFRTAAQRVLEKNAELYKRLR